MNRRSVNPVRRVAVVGGGVAGLGAAWLLSQRHDVTVYESRDRFGGHANTATLDLDGDVVPVDTGFIVYNAPNYPNLVGLFDSLGVVTEPTDMSFGVSLDGGRLEYAGSDLRGLFAQPANALRPRFWRMLHDIRRFYSSAAAYLGEPASLSIGELLEREHYSAPFVDDHLMPMAAAIWSASRRDIAAYPAAAFIRFFDNHGLLNLRNRPQWRTVRGGSINYVMRLIDDVPLTLHTSAEVSTIVRDSGDVLVRDTAGHTARYDDVVIATHADEALRMLDKPSATERAVLGVFDYSANTAYLHEDTRFMPNRRAAWASWNYLMDAGEHDDGAPLSVSYWMNRLQRLPSARNLFVTLNPTDAPRAALTHGQYHYEHPIFSARTSAAQERSAAIQGSDNIWFCGSYLGHGFHEDALQSGLWVAERLGCERPWHAGEFDRLPASYRDSASSLPLALGA